MALEEIIAANTAVTEKLIAATDRQTAILEKLLAGGAKAEAPTADKADATAPAAEDKPKANAKETAAKTEEKSESAEITVETLDAKFRPWLGEFAKDHPETVARKAKFKEILGKLGAAKMSEIEDATKLGKLDSWFDTRAKTWDEGHGVGRFAADPEADSAEDAGDEGDL